MTQSNTTTFGPTAKLVLLADAADADGLPRAGLLMTVQGRRPVLRAFPSLAAALAALRAAEAARRGA